MKAMSPFPILYMYLHCEFDRLYPSIDLQQNSSLSPTQKLTYFLFLS